MTDEKNELQDSLEPDEQTDETVEEVETQEVDADENESFDSDLEDKNKQLFNRAKKAEDELKKLKSQLLQTQKKPKPTSEVSLEELVFIARDIEPEDLSVLKTIQKGSDISLQEAKDSDLFKSYLRDKAEKIKKEKAQLSASAKSLPKKESKPVTRDEHREMFKKMTSNL